MNLWQRIFGLVVAGNSNAPEAVTVAANAVDGEAVFEVRDDGSFFVPYGEYPHKVGMQVFDREAANEIVARHNGIMPRLVKWLTGRPMSYPVYIGHPDVPGTADSDKRAYAWIESVEAGNDGLTAVPKWSEPGAEMIRQGHFRFYSPVFFLREAGRGRMRVTGLKSMGLTNNPNIPVPALANEEDSQPNNDMNPEIIAALGLEEGATPEECLAKITALKDAASAAEAEKAEAENAKCAAETAATEAGEAKQTAENELAAAKQAIEVAANRAVQAAVTAGKLTPAEAEAKTTEVLAANDLGAALAGLDALPPKVKTESTTGNLGAAKTRLVTAANDEAAARRDQRAAAVANELAATNPALPDSERKRIAHERAARRNPELFSNKSSGSAA